MNKQDDLLETAALLIGIAANLITIAKAFSGRRKPRKNRKPRKPKR